MVDGLEVLALRTVGAVADPRRLLGRRALRARRDVLPVLPGLVLLEPLQPGEFHDLQAEIVGVCEDKCEMGSFFMAARVRNAGNVEAPTGSIKDLRSWCPTCAGGTHLRWRCAVGHEWETVPASVKLGRWCRLCAIEARATRTAMARTSRL